VDYKDLKGDKIEESSEIIRKRVNIARDLQLERYKDDNIFNNSQITNKYIKKYCKLSESSEKIMNLAFEKYKFSGRTYNKLLKVSRTIADLDGEESIQDAHLLEAIRYRTLDNKYWG
jgi:magnesium chelatase family protein